ncbi:putative hydroxymethylpyrimidine transport system permease protein [Methylopila capsulata]|uniref:Hydroxymethylpyrimidine transport system permease protein n=2 Tax=Methylopila capsulata TaxID=61654 RepID=A0ABS2T6K7_9HYPH|nr:ABC transporter permease [Methylopila capsulata]MBM7850447.1 putative hydroxymethylpyrimidine transport system permease protein [Methylopila capsulata]
MADAADRLVAPLSDTTARPRRALMAFGRLAATLGVLIAAWQAFVTLSGTPPFLLPPPARVGVALIEQSGFLARQTLTTLTEIVGGLAIGVAVGAIAALAIAALPTLRRWLLPPLIVAQAVPVFAIAPLLVLWLGFGLGSKLAMAALIVFFPVTSAFYDGLRRADPNLVDLARLYGASPLKTLLLIRLPSALPAFGTGLKLAAAAAPIGAVVGEWVGASSGLGFVMIHANARMQTDLLFAALIILAVVAASLWFAVDWAIARLIHWSPEHGRRDS